MYYWIWLILERFVGTSIYILLSTPMSSTVTLTGSSKKGVCILFLYEFTSQLMTAYIGAGCSTWSLDLSAAILPKNGRVAAEVRNNSASHAPFQPCMTARDLLRPLGANMTYELRSDSFNCPHYEVLSCMAIHDRSKPLRHVTTSSAAPNGATRRSCLCGLIWHGAVVSIDRDWPALTAQFVGKILPYSS